MAGVHVAARAAGVKDAQAHALFAAILEQVKNGERVFVKNFGSFFQAQRAERTVTSPQIPGGFAEVPAHLVMRFRPSPFVKAILNGMVAEPETDEAGGGGNGVETNDGDVEGTSDDELEAAPAPVPEPKAKAAPKAKAPAAAKPATPKAAAPKPAPAAAPKRGPGRPATPKTA